MKRFSLLCKTLLAFLLISCTGTSPSSTPTPIPAHPAPIAADPADYVSDFRGAIRFESLSLEEGLSQSSARSILQDRQGFLWIGTEDGLNRYDGYSFKIYRPLFNDPNSLSDRWIFDLFEDRDGYIWIGTRQGGLNRFDPRTEKFIHYRHNAEDPSSVSSNNIRSILQDSAGNIWVGTLDGLDRLDPKTGEFTHYRNHPDDPDSLSSNRITSLLQGKNSTLWVGTGNGGLNQFDPATGTFRHYHHDAKLETSISSDTIHAIREAQNGDLWLATSNGLSRFDPLTGQAMRYKYSPDSSDSRLNNLVSTIYIDRSGTLWVGTDRGLDRFDEQSEKFVNYHHIPALPDSLNSNMILSIYEDREGILWVGTYGGGVSKYNRGMEKFTFYRNDPENPNSLGSNMVFDLHVDPSGITWIGTQNGLDRFNPATGRFGHYRHDAYLPGSLSDNLVWAVLRDSLGKLWVGTRGGLDQYNESVGRFIHHTYNPQDPRSIASNLVYHLYEDRSGELWIGTGEGLDRYDRETGKFIHYVDPENPSGATKDAVIAIREDGDGNLWVGTFNSGLFRLDRDPEKFTYYKNELQKTGSLNNNSIMAITQDQQGNLWIATAGGGLNRYDPATDLFTAYTEEDGLPNDVVYAVIEDTQGFLWLSTNFGVSRFGPNTMTFRNYTTSDGLQGNEFNQGAYAQGPDGAIYFGGVSGFNIFHPERVRDSTYLPPVALTGLTQNGRPIQTEMAVPALNEITLEWPQDSFEFDFTALSFAEPVGNHFAYKLENFDRDWNNIGNRRSGRYTNLPGGTYTLRIRASNSDGAWNETGTAVRVTVIPPFWKTGWFYGLAGLAVLLMVASIYRLRIHGIEVQKRELERQVNERTREMQQLFEQNKELAVIEERNRLARDLHDSAKQKAFASLAQLGTAGGLIAHDITAAKEHLGEAENLVYEVIQELTFLIQEMYPIALKEKGLTTALREYVFEWKTRTDIRVDLQVEGECHLPLEIEQAMYRIVQESLANIARHSRANTVEFSVIYHADHIEVRISDNGQGFDLAQKPNGIGLRSMGERAKSIGGTLIINSAPGKGTCITLNVPIQGQPKPNGGHNA